MSTPVLLSTITCPACGHREEETMPTDACQWFYECVGCKAMLRPAAGDCCVFCSYGSIACPPVQGGARDCCANAAQEGGGADPARLPPA